MSNFAQGSRLNARSLQSVRDWSGILCERSEQRYSGKPDGFAGTPGKKTTRLQDHKTTSFFSDAEMWFFTEKQFREDSCDFVDVFLVME